MENETPQTAPSRFLQRIADYPKAVQQALSAEMTDASLTTYLQVLHGSAPDPAALPSAGAASMLADTMLSRLITSKRFVARLQQFVHLLQVKDPAQDAKFADLLTDMILPLAEQDAPYLYKLDEAIAADPQGALAEVMPALQDILGLCRKLGAKTVSDRRINAEWLAGLILQAGKSGDTTLLNAVFAAIGQPLRLHAPQSQNPKAPISSVGQLFLQKLLQDAAHLSTLDIHSMACIAQSGLEGLTTPRPLTLITAAPQNPDESARLRRLQELGLISAILPEGSAAPDIGGVLALPAGVQISPVTLGWLSCADLPENSLALAAERIDVNRSWGRNIIGYIGDEISLETLAIYRASADAPEHSPRQLLLARVALADTGTDPEADAGAVVGVNLDNQADCYAIVLRLGSAIPVSRYTNIENCLVYDSLADLTQALAGASERMRKKPVVVIGPGSSIETDYLISCASKFRALGSAYLITPLLLQYHGEAGKLLLSAPLQDQITALALAEASVLPLAMLLDRPEEIAAQLQMGVFALTTGFAICVALPAPEDDQTLQRLQRRLANRTLTTAEQEQLFLIELSDFSRLNIQDSILHWPIEALIGTTQRQHPQLKSQLNRFISAPSTADAVQILQHLTPQSTEAFRLAPQIDAFAVKLTETPDVLLDLSPDQLLGFFELCRHTVSADQLAGNLSAYAQTICNKDIGLIVPMFEFLACCLPPSDLCTTLAFTAKVDPKNRRYMFRIAECIRRYGDEPLMVQYLLLIKQHDPKTLQDTTFTRCFQKVLTSPRRAVLAANLGSDILRNIADTVPFAENFRQAVLAQDKAAMQRLVMEPIPDFMKWADGLRALSNELRGLANDREAFALPGISGLYRRKLAAVTFADTTTLRSFDAQGFLNSDADLDVIGQYLLGNTAPLASFITRAFEGSNAPAFEIAGNSTAAVFAHAQAALTKHAPPGSANGADAPLVSVIMSAFNPDIDVMRLSVASILAQTHGAVELFVVDDASLPDSSRAIQDMLAELAPEDRQKIHYSRLDVNSGPYIGRNLALSRARGQFVAIQDADDWSHPQRFAAQLEAFAATPELRLVTSPHVRIDRYGAVQMEAGFSVFGDGPMTSMFRRDLFDEIGGFASIRSRGDVEMRERIRSYYGGHVLRELQMPCMLCFADSATLSQKTKSESAEYLQLFRTNISRKRDFGTLRRAGKRLKPEHSLLVPMPLRPPAEAPE